jgi:hypothetical protein
MSDTKATFTVDTPGFVDESFFGAFRRSMAVQLRNALGEFQSVTVTMVLEATDPDVPAVVPVSEAEAALIERDRKVQAMSDALAYFVSHRA